ncbi:MAG: hypothetical protein IJU34_02660 [Bacteroidales bacterium]|nr:hypothetical protein [Bacteroidales bacterium]
MKRILSIAAALAATVALLAGCSALKNVANNAGINTGSLLNGGIKTYTFYNLPENLEQLQKLPEANMKDPYGVAALVIAALCRYETNPEDCFEMLNWLKGPESLSTYEKQFIKERLTGKTYKPRSYFQGATPNNNYTPSNPYKFRPESNPYTFQNAGWATIWVRSGGADNPRSIKLRQKGSTGEWFLNDIQCLSDIRTPANENPWY